MPALAESNEEIVLYSSEITSIGSGAQEMFDAGVIIFFGVPCPEALAEVSVVHTVRTPLQRDLQVGDTLQVGSTTVSITQVGSIASSNLEQLGHVVVYTDGKDSEALPGAVHAAGKLPLPQIGDAIQIFAGA